MEAIRDNPEPDGVTTFSLLVAPAVFFVRVEEDYTVYFHSTTYPRTGRRSIKVYEIKRTAGTVRNMLRWPPPK
ncbi:MAG: hypothetical protein F4X03_00495 [Dehalococcoidia bacterium]|nr:hypothetical protein [Dehalococcoidia bacterium]MYD27388.1 hypothetical protein [Dehalococcoidia bacterium]